MEISTILSQIDLGSYAMPVFQRGYVWNRDQVRKLMSSLYKGYPIGSLLVWNTATDPDISKGDGPLTPGNVNLILDGQQRMTTLYGIIRGYPPKFFDGNLNSFTNLYFNVEDETFEFYMAGKMKSDRAWINVTELMQKGASHYLQEKLQHDSENVPFWLNHMAILNRLDSIKNIDIHVQTVSGEDKTIDVVVEIFNNVNSGGTKLSKGDLALAKICAEWPDARETLKDILIHFQKAGYNFTMEWLLRCLTVYLTGQPYYNALGQHKIEEIKKALPITEKMIGTCLDHIGTRLGLDHDRVLGSVFAIVTMIGYIRYCGGKLTGSKEWDKLLYWYVHAFLWGRYAGSTESNLAQDLNAINRGEGIDGLIRLLRQSRGDLTIRAEDFWGWSTGARFYPLLYLLTRTNHSRDWGTNIELSNNLLGKNSTLDVHHIFPKDLLYKAGKTKSIVNALANYAFLTKETNIEISNRSPEEYLPVYMERCPGAVESHWIPVNRGLWKIDNYEHFLSERRILLAKAANDLLDSLYSGKITEVKLYDYSTKQYVSDRSEEDEIDDMSSWMASFGLNEGTINHELLDDDGNVVAIIDLAWPNGVQSGLSEPIALLLNETAETQAEVSKHGYRYYTSVQELKGYIEDTYLL
ncbi:MAG: DUF262 domain-containing protein [Clostridiales bacterium]|nr:DUF262 domain-containing protein [Clostridiales bacterium]